jgi:hypothetical protein
MKLKILTLGLLCGAFIGCTTVEKPPATIKSQQVTPAGDVLGDVERYMRTGDFAKAAELFLQRAANSSGIEKSHAQLRACAALARQEQWPQAKQLLATITINEQDSIGQQLLRLTNAHIALAERRPNQVQVLLTEKLPDMIPATYQGEFHQLRATAYTLLGNRMETARELVTRETYLTDNSEIKTNQQEIWTSLASMSERALQQFRAGAPADNLTGWTELVAIAKVYQLSPVRLKEQITLWRHKYSAHPVTDGILNGLTQRKQEDVAHPDRVALLVPLSGKFAKAGEALRDGFLAAYYTRRPNAKQTIRIYDVGDDNNKIREFYRKALDDGAQFIVGPLEKEAVQQLLQLDEFPVPTLTLNFLPDEDKTLRGNLFQFGLSPEEEARQVADRTWLDGHVNAAALVPAGPWGERMLASFKERWTTVGGKIVEVQTYDPAKTNFSDPIQALLNIDESQRRHRRVAATIKRDVKFTARRRTDVDFIFLAAYPLQGRQIQPQLNFFNATDIPVYTTSHVFTGTLNQERDRDMDGIIFGDMPWVLSGSSLHRDLRMEIETNISESGNSLQRLYALGIDAFNVIGALNTLRNYPYERFDGETGSLSLDNNLRIRRQLTWVKFRTGRPVVIEQGSL